MAKAKKPDVRCVFCGRKAMVVESGAGEYRIGCINERCHVNPHTDWASKRETAIRWFTTIKVVIRDDHGKTRKIRVRA